jgi:hypothetical protein
MSNISSEEAPRHVEYVIGHCRQEMERGIKFWQACIKEIKRRNRPPRHSSAPTAQANPREKKDASYLELIFPSYNRRESSLGLTTRLHRRDCS